MTKNSNDKTETFRFNLAQLFDDLLKKKFLLIIVLLTQILFMHLMVVFIDDFILNNSNYGKSIILDLKNLKKILKKLLLMKKI